MTRVYRHNSPTPLRRNLIFTIGKLQLVLSMVLLRALLLGDVATLNFSTQDNEHQDDSGGKGIGYILRRSFGKISKVPSPREPASSSSPSQQETGLLCLQLSLEEAFYLAHIDECLALAVSRVGVVVPTAPTALPSSPTPPRKSVLEACSGLPHDQHHPQQVAEEDTGGAMSEDVLRVGFSGGSGGGFVPLSTVEEAWRYCCDRRPDFPAMFAVYRHFRGRRYTVHTGHKYGTHFVLYEGPPDECHSRYCVHVMGGGCGDSWSHIKTATRLMPDVAKCLLVCGVTYRPQKTSEPGLPTPMDTSSLAALAVAEVTALSFSRSREPDGGGGGGGKRATRGESTTVVKVGPGTKSASSSGKSAKKKKKSQQR